MTNATTAAKTVNVADLTREQKLTLIYRHTHSDFKSKIGNDKTILTMRNGATCLVGLVDLTDAEIADKLDYAVSKEKKRLAAAAEKAAA
ncbi:hypothetical protein [Paraburkholderia sp. GAS32]|uniref:hypothetical protein n=1 Tax=Paraburkholderia sp. GAS32 TaxID=3035129 RepID=UPI003D1E6D05